MLPSKSAKYHDILRQFELISVQGHPRSSILVYTVVLPPYLKFLWSKCQRSRSYREQKCTNRFSRLLSWKVHLVHENATILSGTSGNHHVPKPLPRRLTTCIIWGIVLITCLLSFKTLDRDFVNKHKDLLCHIYSYYKYSHLQFVSCLLQF